MTATHEPPPPQAGRAPAACRLPPQPGEWIDRGRPVRFRFEGHTYYGFQGDAISSALAACGVRLLGRSFKYHRPRGIHSLANHDVNVLMADGRRTNLRADITPLWEGADLVAVNTFGGLEHDQARHINRFGRFLPVGFYYKTFHQPRRLFAFWERQMRAMAGLGAIDPKSPRRRTTKRYDWCDLLVVGAGASGLSAAIAAAEQQLRVIVVDEQPHAGGALLYQADSISAAPDRPVADFVRSQAASTNHGQNSHEFCYRAADLLHDLLTRAAAFPNLDLRTGTVAAGYYADHWLALVDEQRMTKLRAHAVVLATGALEQPAVFGNNDLPGVMLASAAQRLVRLYAVKPFERPVVLTVNAEGYRAALAWQRLGIDVRLIVDLRPTGEPSELAKQAAAAGIPIRRGQAIYGATSGGEALGVTGVTVSPLGADGQPDVRQAQHIECDGVAMSVGWSPADALFCQARGKMKYSHELAQFVPDVSPSGVFTAGRMNGVYELDARLADGRRAGLAAVAHLGRYAGAMPEVSRSTVAPSHPYPVVEQSRGKAFVDLDEDVQLKDIKHAVQEGFDGIELLKRYSTFGMGPSQGKTANTNTIRVLARLRGQGMDEIGSPTARPFYHPVPLGHLAGRGFHPHRQTALDARHRAAGALFMPAGDWRRPAYYAVPGLSREQAIAAEVEAVRTRVGLIDVGTLGKIEIYGADAAEFLERIYTGRFAKMKIGTTRYGLMCDESGVVIDDGVVARLADDRFYVTTTTTASANVYREMQRWAIVWKMQVVLANLTGSMAAMNVAGPNARSIVDELSDVDVSEASFPYLGVREGSVLGVPARLLRTGFVGEVGYEIHLPSFYAASVWDGIIAAGARHGIRPFGVEAQRVLRLEKAHVIIGQDTDGLTTPDEAGLGWAVKHDKPFFVGGRSLQIVARKPLKRRLVGFVLPRGYTGPLPSECHLVIDRGEIAGRVTSIARSPTLRQAIGLAYVRPSQVAPGTQIQIRVDGKLIGATVVELPFYDRPMLRQAIGSPESGGRESGGGEPRAILRTSPVHEELEQLHPRWESVGGLPVATNIGDVAAQRAAAAKLGLCDLSALARLLLKGPAAAEFLAVNGIAVPRQIYEHHWLDDGSLCIRTGGAEFFLEDGSEENTLNRLREALARHIAGVLPVWRQDVSLAVTGSEATALFAQVCSFNFAEAGEQFVMTQIAGVSCSVLPYKLAGEPAWRIWADGTYGAYLWHTLLGIAHELGGDAVGTSILRGNVE
ncbi:MAG TPA: FAD-dependent oxidoreductase [Pirellulales bacterium]|nr:FAD-dependent oxidoreductase [Pirellulales bacterium]